jgi:hypothetical protein
MNEETKDRDNKFLCTSQDNDLIDLKARREASGISISIQENNELVYINMTATQARALGEWLLKATQAGETQ